MRQFENVWFATVRSCNSDGTTLFTNAATTLAAALAPLTSNAHPAEFGVLAVDGAVLHIA